MSDTKYKNQSFRYYTNFFFILLAVHGMAWLIRAVAFSGIFAEAAEMELPISRYILICYSLLCVIVFSAWRSVSLARDGASRRAYLALSEEQTPPLSSLMKYDLKKDLIELAVYAGLQIPFLIFYSFLGYFYVGGTGFEGFYTMHAGIYEITRIGILGFLIDCAIYFASLKLFRLIVFKNWEKDRIKHPKGAEKINEHGK